MNRRRTHKQEEARRRRIRRVLAAVLLFILCSLGVDLLTRGRRNQEPPPRRPGAMAVISQAAPREKALPPGQGRESPERAGTRPDGPLPHPPLWRAEPATGDLKRMVQARRVRVLVPFSKTFYYLDRGRQQGITSEALVLFEQFLNQRLDTGPRPVEVVARPTPRARLLPDLCSGLGDIAAGNLAITPARMEQVDFSEPFLSGVDEIVVTSRQAPPLENLFALSGRTVFVRPSSSYFESLQKLNDTLEALGRQPVKVVRVSRYLEDEDLLEMVDAGLVPMTVIDAHKGRLWAGIFGNIRLHPRARLRTGGEIAWAVRKDSPRLLELINAFVRTHRKGTLHGNILYNRYLVDPAMAENALRQPDRGQIGQLMELFTTHGGRYRIDPVMLLAMAFQESGLDNSRRGPDGAVGIMQIRPATARDPHVNISRVDELENNIHAGAKYLRFLMDRYFSAKDMDEVDRHLFALAAYNAGPARIARLRVEARVRGLDPDRWFGSVEALARQDMGRETPRYVANVYKYYMAYSFLLAKERLRNAGRDRLEKNLR